MSEQHIKKLLVPVNLDSPKLCRRLIKSRKKETISNQEKYRCKGPRIDTGRFGPSRCLLLARFGASILEPDLNARLGQAKIVRELLAHERIGIVGLLKKTLQRMDLLRREVRP